jgi:hypothetical protein
VTLANAVQAAKARREKAAQEMRESADAILEAQQALADFDKNA